MGRALLGAWGLCGLGVEGGDPPPPNNDPVHDVHRHTYDRPGTYTATFAYNQGDDCGSDPYRSRGQATITLTVRP